MSIRLEYHLTINGKKRVLETLEQVRIAVNATHGCGTVQKSTVAKELRRITNNLPKDASTETRKQYLKAMYELTGIAEFHGGDLYAPVWVCDKPYSLSRCYDMVADGCLHKALEYAIEGRGELSVVPRRNKTKLDVNICADTYVTLYREAEVLGVDPATLIENALDEYFEHCAEAVRRT